MAESVFFSELDLTDCTGDIATCQLRPAEFWSVRLAGFFSQPVFMVFLATWMAGQVAEKKT